MTEPIDHEREDDYASAIENNRSAALAWLNTAMKKMSHEVEVGLEGEFHRESDIFHLHNGADLHVSVTFMPPEEKP